MDKKFWLVMGGDIGTTAHDSRTLARDEAIRLAEAQPEKIFYVLEAIELWVADEDSVKQRRMTSG